MDDRHPSVLLVGIPEVAIFVWNQRIFSYIINNIFPKNMNLIVIKKYWKLHILKALDSYASFWAWNSSWRAIRASFVSNVVRLFCLVTHWLSAFSAKLKLCDATTSCNSFITIRMAECPPLNNAVAKNAATSTIFRPTWRCLGANRRTVELKLSFAFCVRPPNESRKNICRNFLTSIVP